MTETDPGRRRDTADAGTTGSRREDIGASTPPDESASSSGTSASGRATTGDTPNDGGSGSFSAGTTEEQAVRRDIEETRRELGDSVEALIHKTDIKGRVQGRVHETVANVGDDVKRMGTATADTATGLVDRVKGAAPHALDKVKEAAPHALDKVRDVTPVEVRQTAGKVSAEVSKRPAATLAVTAALALLVFRAVRRRRSR
ncbi:DUF3618 domain-containing protein [Planobispora siamensis]|uniref:DUF3618 domain-containing protein n=1 Tax=Planobispora siamensis TaxID=936338 RepID=A0A8J3SG58_9ACTN|nr:DUF3618 domain-containing protein [Planobispora siamensis]GIH92714.1 hypothetical protein Psi01_33440 [Planobispora siamensis]